MDRMAESGGLSWTHFARIEAPARGSGGRAAEPLHDSGLYEEGAQRGMAGDLSAAEPQGQAKIAAFTLRPGVPARRTGTADKGRPGVKNNRPVGEIRSRNNNSHVNDRWPGPANKIARNYKSGTFMVYVLVAFLISLVVTLLLVRYNTLHAKYTADHDLSGVQKYHATPVPRVGGISIIASMFGICVLVMFREPDLQRELLVLMMVSMPTFLGGLAEDLTKKVRVLVRLGLAMVSGCAAYYFCGAELTRLDIIGVDWLLQFTAVSFIFTAIAMAGAANAINIIDGYNGLAAVVSAMIFAGFAYVSYYLGDRLLLVTCVGMIGAIAGFLVWNYPRGLIFLGDGGAYFIGFMIGAISVLMLARHPEVSAWFPLLLCIYPVFETLFSIYRKKFLRGQSPGMPDGVHLHMLIYKRLIRWAGGRELQHQTQRNAKTSPYLWLLSSFAIIPAVLFWQYQYVLILFVFLFSATYLVLYRKLVRFDMPRWLVMRPRRRPRTNRRKR